MIHWVFYGLLFFPGDIDQIIFEGRLVSKNSTTIQDYKKDVQFINGVSGYKLLMQQHIKVW